MAKKPKRPTIRGKGADLFLNPDPGEKPVETPSLPPIPRAQQKITFAMPADLAERLDDACHALKKRDRKKFSKQAIINAAVALALDEHDKTPETSSLVARLTGTP